MVVGCIFINPPNLQELDPYYPFEEAVDVWARTFAALGINYKVWGVRHLMSGKTPHSALWCSAGNLCRC